MADISWEDDWEDIAETGPSTPSPPPKQSSTPLETPQQSPPTSGVSGANTPVISSTASKPHASPPNGTPTSTLNTPTTSTTSTAPISDEALRKERDAALRRAKTIELKLFAVTRERDALRSSSDKRSANTSLLKQKDEQIKAVLAEGEKLSIKISEKEAAIKSNRAQIANLEARVDTLEKDIGAAEARFEAAKTRERSAEAAQRATEASKEVLEKRIRALESDATTANASALEASKNELATFKKASIDALKATETRLAKEYEDKIANVQKNHEKKILNLNTTLDELRIRLVDDNNAAGNREDRLRRDVLSLREQCSSLEARAEELAAAVPHATRPLLRQIDALQATATERARANSITEKTLLERARDAEMQKVAALEREKASEEKLAGVNARSAALAEQVRLARSARENLDDEITRMRESMEKARTEAVAEGRKWAEKLRAAQRERDEVKNELRKERAKNLDLQEDKDRTEKELKEKVAALEAKLEMAREAAERMEKERNDAVSAGGIPGTPRRPLSSRKSISEIAELVNGEEGNNNNNDGNNSVISSTATSAAFATEPNSGLYATERLASVLRQRTGEVKSLQARLEEKDTATKALAEELFAVTKRFEDTRAQINDGPALKQKLETLEKRHNTLLVLLGEREEKINELEADLSDVKDMYKEQVNELLMRIERIQGGAVN